MAKSTGLVLAAGAIAAANETIFAPVAPAATAGATGTAFASFNWRLVPATAVLALTLGGLETVAPGFAEGLGALILLAVLIVPIGNAPTPIDNIMAKLNLKAPPDLTTSPKGTGNILGSGKLPTQQVG